MEIWRSTSLYLIIMFASNFLSENVGEETVALYLDKG